MQPVGDRLDGALSPVVYGRLNGVPGRAQSKMTACSGVVIEHLAAGAQDDSIPRDKSLRVWHPGRGATQGAVGPGNGLSAHDLDDVGVDIHS